MKIVKASLKGRAFALQFMEIMAEFGHEIPWLEPVKSLTFSTSGRYFRDQLLKKFGCEEEEIIPLQLVTHDASKEYIGGMIYFPKSPENFRDFGNLEAEEKLIASGYKFISCLQIRSMFRGQKNGTFLMRKALECIKKNNGPIWGVVSHKSLIPWYQALGAKIMSPPENKDGLWILAW